MVGIFINESELALVSNSTPILSYYILIYFFWEVSYHTIIHKNNSIYIYKRGGFVIFISIILKLIIKLNHINGILGRKTPKG